MDSPAPLAVSPDADAAAVDAVTADTATVSPYAAEMFARQPFRGYALTSVLSSGECRAVFKAHDETMDRPVAVKVMRPWPGREGGVEEFFSLAGSVARLRAPGVARGLDVGRADGNFFMVYEFLPGVGLLDRVGRRQTGKFTEKEALRLVREMALVLGSLFERGNPHGNLKPSNVIVAEGGKPRLADIGFAWNLAWPDDDTAFRAHPDFLPPERLAGEINIDIRGDLYSLGAMWFWLVMGRAVFVGETAEETVRMHREVKAPALGTIDPKISADTSKLVRWLLEKDRDLRPRTPKEFLKRLAAHPLLAEEGAAAAEEGDDIEVAQGTEV